jgi:hypothetical protein
MKDAKEEYLDAQYEKFVDGRPKFRLMWTNNTKHFYIDDKEVTEDFWVEAVKEDNINTLGKR